MVDIATVCKVSVNFLGYEYWGKSKKGEILISNVHLLTSKEKLNFL